MGTLDQCSLYSIRKKINNELRYKYGILHKIKKYSNNLDLKYSNIGPTGPTGAPYQPPLGIHSTQIFD